MAKPDGRRPVIGTVEGSFPVGCEMAVNLAGGDLLIIPTDIAGKDIAQMFGRLCDGLLLMGGGDIAPGRYGQANLASVGISTRRDKVEAGLLEMAQKSHRPILGICRGHQMLAVESGGSLYQHIGEYHRGAVHDVSLVGGTMLRKVLAELVIGGEIMVNSYHHQAVQTIPDGFRVAGHCGRTIEAMEHVSEPWIGVQFHPELLVRDDPDWLCLFEWLVRGARRWRKEYRK